ncbi:MAG: winged helix-turn-helix domain-containing protein [Pseudomonadota bacterium]
MANTQLWTVDKDTPFQLAGRHVDPARREITYAGNTSVVEPRVMALLMQLCETPEKPVRRDALMDAVWPGSPGAESSLSNAVSLLRQALHDQPSDAGERLIKTVPKIGYCLTAAPARSQVAQEALQARTRLGVIALSAALLAASVLWLFGWDQHAPEEIADNRLFVVVTSIESERSLRPLAHALSRDATTLLERSNMYRVADPSEAYRVSAGQLDADLVIEATLMESEAGLQLSATWSRKGSVDAVRDFDVAPGAVLTLRDQWLEAIAVETALIAGTGDDRADTSPEDRTETTVNLPPTTNNADAFEAYSNGLYLASQYRPELMPEAIENLERAIQLDPEFAMAWAQLGRSLMQAGSHQGVLRPGATRVRARDALIKAVSLQPDLALAYEALGDYYNCVAREPLLAQRAFDQLFKIAPDFASPAYTRLLLLHYDKNQAVAQIDKHSRRYPDSLTWRLIAAQHFLAADELAPALRLADDALTMAPNFTEAKLTAAKIRSSIGEHDDAIAMLDTLSAEAPAATRIAAHHVIALARAGRQQEAIALRDTTLDNASDAKATHLAMVYAWTGATDQAFIALDTALEEREFGLCYVATEPIYAPLRDDPRFERIVQVMRGAAVN